MTGELYRAVENNLQLCDETFNSYIAMMPYGAVCLVIDKQPPEISNRIRRNLSGSGGWARRWLVMFDGVVGYVPGDFLEKVE